MNLTCSLMIILNAIRILNKLKVFEMGGMKNRVKVSYVGINGVEWVSIGNQVFKRVNTKKKITNRMDDRVFDHNVI